MDILARALRRMTADKRAAIGDWPGVIRVPAALVESPLLWDMMERMHAEGRPVRYERPASLGPAYIWIGGLPKEYRLACGAKTRKGTPCKAKAVDGRGRCRMHGGLSSGPRTAEGRARISESNRRRAQARREARAG